MTGSLMDGLRAQRAEAAKHTTIDLPIPGYDSLVARYRLIDPLVESKEIGARVTKQYPGKPQEQTFWALVDTLIEACEGLYVRRDDGKVDPLDPDDAGDPVRYDVRLAAGLGIDPGDPAEARTILLGVFNGNKLAVNAHAVTLAEWMIDPAGSPLGEA